MKPNAIVVLALAAACAAPFHATAQEASVRLTPEQAQVRLQQGETLERQHNTRGALEAYTDAAESGNAHAQRRLGDVYGMGQFGVERNYETALRWYHKAREQGIEIPKPFTYPGMPTSSLRR